MAKINYPTRRSIRYDAALTSPHYVGEAAIGQDENAPQWRIFRLTFVGESLDLEWADGDDLFDNVWANRASLTYS
jgi:hypothetical protein